MSDQTAAEPLAQARAIRFHHPDLDTADEPAGLGLSTRGRLATVAGPEAVRQSLLLLLTTVPGERVMRPAYGCQLHRILFWPNDDTTAGLAIHYVRQAVERFEPRIDIIRVDAERSEGRSERLDVVLAYRVRATGAVDEVSVAVDLHGGG
jgi:phage baseplate assembly protein W